MAESPYVYDITPENFQQIIIEGSAQYPVLVDFWADWCQPCQTLMPILEKLADEYQGNFILARVDTEAQAAIAQHFGVRNLPTVKLFANGEVLDEFSGALPESEVRAFLDKYVTSESDPAIGQAQQMLLGGDGQGAVDLLVAAQAAKPNDMELVVALAQAYVAVDRTDLATDALDAIPADMQDSPEVQQLRAYMHFGAEGADAPNPDELEARLAKDENDSEARYKLAISKVNSQEFESAFEHLLTLMTKDNAYNDGIARTTLLKLFESLGDDPMVAVYRRRMFNLLH